MIGAATRRLIQPSATPQHQRNVKHCDNLRAPQALDMRVCKGVLTSTPPEIASDWALFLDLDGTLLDIASRPDAVTVPADLPARLAKLSAALGGAVAIVSGRPAAAVDALLTPFAPPGGFGHGTEIRLPGGAARPSEVALPLPARLLRELHSAIASWPGVLLEAKPHGIALHYRQAPHHQQSCHNLLQRCAAQHPRWAVLSAHMACELRPRAATKALPVETLMNHPPFAGRRPVFIGDDVTDEDGMAAARRMGGLGLRVGEDFADAAAVRAWVRRGVAA